MMVNAIETVGLTKTVIDEALKILENNATIEAFGKNEQVKKVF
jgi:hypothetical protein